MPLEENGGGVKPGGGRDRVGGGLIGGVGRRLVFGPVRAVVGSPRVGRVVRSNVNGVAASAGGVLESEAERAVDVVLAGPFPEAMARLLVERRVVERVVSELSARGDLERMIASAAGDERTEDLVRRVLADPETERMLVDVVDSRLAIKLTDRLLQSPQIQQVIADAVRSGLARQTSTLADEVAAGAHRLDARVERAPRRWARRPARPQTLASSEVGVPYAGLGSRLGALAVDAVAVHLVYLVGVAMVGFVAGLADWNPSRSLVDGLAGGAWLLVVAAYFTAFWAAAGQTPGMRLLRLRLTDMSGSQPGVGRSLLRLIGCLAAVSFLFIGFLPVLVDSRRRALQDFLARTLVVYDPSLPAVVHEPPSTTP
jgi:uncharacterized RDD family membrane protein YckC